MKKSFLNFYRGILHSSKKFLFSTFGVASVLLGIILICGCPPAPTPAPFSLPSDAKPTCTVPSVEFAGWFESGSVSLNGVVKPANSVMFSDNPNCDFYKWSEQMFLWLTSPAPGIYGGGAHVFDSPVFYDVSPMNSTGDRTLTKHTPGRLVLSLRAAQVGPHKLPIIFDKLGRMVEIQNPVFSKSGKPVIFNERGDSVEFSQIIMGNDRKPVFLDNDGKEIKGAKPMIRPELTQLKKSIVVQKFMIDKIPVFIDFTGSTIDVDQGQAGDSGVLLAQNGSLVYYATMVNDVYAYFLTGTKNGGITPMPTQFPTTQAELDKIIAFAALHSTTFPDPEALAVEVKSSWIKAEGLADIDNFITMKATIPTYDKTDPDRWVQNGSEDVVLALTGMHVVGSASGHPEMIWSTFEHVKNAPNAGYTYINASNVAITVPRNTAGDWLFCASGATAPFNAMNMQYDIASQSIVRLTSFTPANVIRWKAWGGAFNVSPNPIASPATPATAASNTELISCNNSVLGQLISGDVRANYIMTGSTWTIGGDAPGGSFPSGNEVGTSKMENTTMETFQQGSDSLFATGLNCFSCHITNIVNPGKDVPQVSHIFGPLQPLF